MISHLATILFLCTSLVSTQTLPMLCGNSLTDSRACSFDGDYCSFTENFDGAFRATDFLIYDGNPFNHEFVVESGKPFIRDNQLVMPLGNTGDNENSGAAIVSTTRFLNFGSFEARLKTIGQSSVVTTFMYVDKLYVYHVVASATFSTRSISNGSQRMRPKGLKCKPIGTLKARKSLT
jgi:hypothetical protein